ncbi:unnamed protein product, partial [Dovyalis caffra]
MYRAASLMRKQNVQAALAEINRIFGFKLALECLELRARGKDYMYISNSDDEAYSAGRYRGVNYSILGSSDVVTEVMSSTHPKQGPSPTSRYNCSWLSIKHAIEHKDEEKSNEAK